MHFYAHCDILLGNRFESARNTSQQGGTGGLNAEFAFLGDPGILMNNEQTHTDESTVDVEEEKQPVEDSTEVVSDEANETGTSEPMDQVSDDETEAESDDTEAATTDTETGEEASDSDETAQTDSVDDTDKVTEPEESTPTVEVQSDTSEAESEETFESAEVESDTPEAEIEAETPTAEAESDTPEAEIEAETPTAEAESDTPEAEIEAETPTAEAESDTPEAEIEAETPTAEAESDTPEAEVEAETPTAEAESDTPEAEVEAETPTAEAESDSSEEQDTAMSQESLEEAYDNSLKAFTDGEIVKGTVVDVSRDEVMIDIGFKSEGYIPAEEFDSDENDLPSVKVGDEIDVYIVRREDSEGQINLSKKIADQTLVWDEITEAFESGSPVEGQITERIKGGLRVTVGTLRGFLPASQVELRPIQNLDQYIGETFQMKVISMSKRRHNIVLSRRAWLEAEMAEKKDEVLKTLEVGQLITGVVKNITAFGAFVDLGGVDGLLHKTDMAWKRIHHPSEIVSIGDEIEVQVIAIGRESEKISLGLKQKTSDPWENVEEKYPIGSQVSGNVVNIVNYGVFVQLEEAVEGLIHVSEMAWTRRNVAPSRIVSKGDKIDAIVLEISKEDKRISLGIKQLQQNPWELLEQKYPVGTKILGRIRNLTNFGAFVEIEDGIDGLIHTSDLSWTDRGSNPQEILKEGEEVEVVVLQIDASERRVSLGFKQTQPDPWDEVPEKYKIGSVVRGQIVNLTSFGAFTKLEEGIDGLIHISEIADRRIERPEEVVSVGDELDVKVINLDPKGRRIGLSLKAAIADQERASMPEDERPERPERRERQERPRRERSAPRREPRQPKPVEEEETMMGALLKQEMGKNNVENLMNSQETETPETSQETETPETSQETETPETSQETETPETSQETETPETSQETETPETSQETETPETSQETETPETSQEPETPETPETSQETETPETSQETETPETPETSQETETPETSQEPETPETSQETETPETSQETETPETSQEPDSSETSEETQEPDSSETSEETQEPDSSETSEETQETDGSETSEETQETDSSETSEETQEIDGSETSEETQETQETDSSETSEETQETDSSETSEETQETDSSETSEN